MLVLSHRSANYANKPAEANFAPKPLTGDDKCPNKCENVSQTGLCKHLRDSPVIPARHPIIQTRFTKSRGEGRTAWWGSTGEGRTHQTPTESHPAGPVDSQAHRCSGQKPSSSSHLSDIHHHPVALWGKVIGDLAVEATPSVLHFSRKEREPE